MQLTRLLKPDVLIMDIMMPHLNGIQAAGQVNALKLPTKILLLSMHLDAVFVHQALQQGVRGYILKSSVSEELIQAVQAVALGKTYLSAPVSEVVVELAVKPEAALQKADPLEALSPREKEILQLIAEEYTSAEIAERLFISVKTVEKHRASLMQKLGVRNIAGLVRAAVKYRLVDRDAQDMPPENESRNWV